MPEPTNVDRLRQSLSSSFEQREPRQRIIPGLLGAVVDGTQRVQVVNRPGYAYVRLRGNPGEVVEAFNETVNYIYDMPVLLEQDPFMPKVYRIIRRDFGLYLDWPTAGSNIPRHGDQHSFGYSSGSGTDVVWVFKRQLMPLLVHPHPSESSIFDKYVQVEQDFYSWNGTYVHFTGASVDLSSLFPASNTQSRFVLVYVNGANAVEIATGSLFTSDPWPDNETLFSLFPSITTQEGIPLGVVTLHGREDEIRWEHLYDVRSLWAGYEGKGVRAIVLSDLSSNRLLDYPATAAGLQSAIDASDTGDNIFIPTSTITGDFEFKSGTSVVGQEQFKTTIAGTVTLNASVSVQSLTINDTQADETEAIGVLAPTVGTALLTSCSVAARNTSSGNASALKATFPNSRVALRGSYLQARSTLGEYADVFRIETGTFQYFEAQQCTFDNNTTTSKDANWSIRNTGTVYLFGSNWVPEDYDPYGEYDTRIGDRKREWWSVSTGEDLLLTDHPTKVYLFVTGSPNVDVTLPATPSMFDDYHIYKRDGASSTGTILRNGNNIDGAAANASVTDGHIHITSDGSNWFTDL